jgi:FKBP-type peptidyl-prolyl cis-trans isomerase
MSNALVGVSQNLVDITVGSRVVLSLPAEQAQGKEPVVVVIDVLARDPAQASGASEDHAGSAASAAPQTSAGPTPKDHS